jgi:class 3 adenylate cyclase
MAVFGAPQSAGNDSLNAVLSAQRLIEERTRLNRTSRYRIDVGVGIASGMVVAGCMGSDDRLNYTVLGGRVNLAARLCAKAERMQILIDEATRERVADVITVETLPALQLKGFTLPVEAFRVTAVGSVATAS